MSTLRYTTDCFTGIRHWFRYATVGRPLRAAFGPCAKAAVLGIPLIAGPAVPYPSPYPGASVAPYAYANGASADVPSAPGVPPSTPGGGLFAVPGTIPSAALDRALGPVAGAFVPHPRAHEAPAGTPAVVSTPEPGSFGLLLVGIFALWLTRRPAR